MSGRCASLVALQRKADTHGVSNDGAPGLRRSLDDLTAALANEPKTLREIVDRQAE
jgi:uncharacterized protein (DUF2336 family)